MTVQIPHCRRMSKSNRGATGYGLPQLAGGSSQLNLIHLSVISPFNVFQKHGFSIRISGDGVVMRRSDPPQCILC
jgi:hypothetical protein